MAHAAVLMRFVSDISRNLLWVTHKRPSPIREHIPILFLMLIWTLHKKTIGSPENMRSQKAEAASFQLIGSLWGQRLRTNLTSLKYSHSHLSLWWPACAGYFRVPELLNRHALSKHGGSRYNICNDVDNVNQMQRPSPRPFRLRIDEDSIQKDKDRDPSEHSS
jgi:hypothetical protein